MTALVARHALLTCTWGVLIFLLVLSCLIGSVSSVAAVLFALPLLLVFRRTSAWSALFGQPATLIFLAVFFLLAAVFAITQRNSGNVLYFANFLALLTAAPVYVVARRWSGSGPLLTIVSLSLVGTLIGAIYAVDEVVIKHMPRAFGWGVGGNLMPRVALTLGFIALAGIFVAPAKYRLHYMLGLEFAFIATFLSGSRGAALALPVMALILAAFVVVGKPFRHPWRVLGGSFLVLALTYAGLTLLTAQTMDLANASPSIALRFQGLASLFQEVLTRQGSESDQATSYRMMMASAAFEAFKISPWIGYGWGNLAYAAAPFMDMGIWGGPEDPYFQYHSDLANFAVAAGSVGILCWLALLAAPLAGLLATPRDRFFVVRLYCCLQLSFGYGVFGLTDMTFGYDLPTTLYAFLTAIVLGAFRDTPAIQPGR